MKGILQLHRDYVVAQSSDQRSITYIMCSSLENVGSKGYETVHRQQSSPSAGMRQARSAQESTSTQSDASYSSAATSAAAAGWRIGQGASATPASTRVDEDNAGER